MGKLLTRQEAAERLTVTVRTLDTMIARGGLRAYRIGPKLVRIDEEDIDAYLKNRLVAPVVKKKPELKPRPCLYYPGMKVV